MTQKKLIYGTRQLSPVSIVAKQSIKFNVGRVDWIITATEVYSYTSYRTGPLIIGLSSVMIDHL